VLPLLAGWLALQQQNKNTVYSHARRAALSCLEKLLTSSGGFRRRKKSGTWKAFPPPFYNRKEMVYT